MPTPGAIDTTGLDVSDETMEELLQVDRSLWQEEAAGIGEYFAQFGDRLPAAMREQLDNLKQRLATS